MILVNLEILVNLAGVSINFKTWIFYKDWFPRFGFFISRSCAVFYKMKVVFFIKSAHFIHFNYFWSQNSDFAKCDIVSNKILEYFEINILNAGMYFISRQWTCHIWPDAPFPKRFGPKSILTITNWSPQQLLNTCNLIRPEFFL